MSTPDPADFVDAPPQGAQPSPQEFASALPDLKANYDSASRVSPDEAAKVETLSGKTGMAKAFVAKNPKQAEAAAQRPSDAFFADVQANYPNTASLMADPAKLAVTHDALANQVAIEHVSQNFKYATTYFQALKAAAEGSVFGHIYDRGEPDIRVGPPSSFGQNLVGAAAQYALDSPFYVIGGAAGAIAAGPLGVGPGAFMLPAFLKSGVDEYFGKGKTTSISDTLERAWNVAKATGKEGAVGLLTEMTGLPFNKAALGAFIPADAELAKMTFRQVLAKMAAQNVAMNASGAAINGQPMTFRDLSTNAILAAGLTGVHMAGGSIFDRSQAGAGRDYVNALDDLVKGDPFRARDAAGFSEQLNKVFPDPVRMPVEAFEAAGLDKMATHLGLDNAYAEGKRTGEVAIPLGTLMSEPLDPIRGKLMDDVKFDSDSKTPNQVKAIDDEAAAAKKAEADKAQSTQEQGIIQQAVSRIKAAFGIKEEAPAPAAKPAEEAKPPLTPPVSETPLSDEPAVAEQQTIARNELSAAHVEMGEGEKTVMPANQDQGITDKLSKLEQSAQTEAERVLSAPLIESMKAENVAKYNEAHAKATERATADVDQLPVFQAGTDLQTTFGKQEPAEIANKFLEGRATPTEAAQFQAIAELNGFESSDEMASKIVNAWKSDERNNLIRAIADKDVEHLRPLNDPANLRLAAIAAMHSEKSGELLALKQEIFEGMKLGEKQDDEYRAGIAERAKAAWEDAKQFARDTIAGKPISEAGAFRPYYTAERDAALRSAKASKAGDYEATAQALKEQLNNHALAAEAFRARDAIVKWTKAIERQQRADPTSFKKQEHFDQAAELMRRFGFEREDYDPSAKTESLPQWVERMQERTAGGVTIPAWLQDESVSKPYRELTLNQFHDLRDSIANVKRVGNIENEMLSIRKGESLGALVDEMLAAKEANTKGGKTRRAGDPESVFDKLVSKKDAIRNGIISTPSLLSKMDGFRDGIWTDLLAKSYETKRSAELGETQEFAEKWRDLHSVYSLDERRDNDTKPIFIPELKASKTKNQLLTLAAYQGVADAKEKVAADMGLHQSVVDGILDRHLDKRDRDFVQAKVDLIGSYRGKLADLYSRKTGFEPEWVEAIPVQTKHGEYKGGYYPLIPDPMVSVKSAVDLASDESLADPYPTWKAATRNGYIEARNQYARYPVSLDADGALRHMNDVIHDLHFNEWVTDANRLLGDKSVAASLIDALGRDGQQQVNRWVKEIAGNDVKPTRDLIERMAQNVRQRTTIAMLGSNVAVALSQFHGLTLAGRIESDFGMLDAVGGALGGFKTLAFNPSGFRDMVDFAHESSPFMRSQSERLESSLAAMNQELQGRVGAIRAGTEAVSSGFFRAVHYLTSIPIWTQAYKAAVNTRGLDHDGAVAYADHIIRESTITGDKADLPPIYKNSETGKLVTQFCGFFNKQVQALYKAQGRLRNEGISGTPEFIGSVAAISVLPGALYALTHYGLPDDKGSKQKWEKALIRTFSPLTMIPVANTIQDMVIDRIVGSRGYGHVPAPAAGIFDAIDRAIGSVGSRRQRTEAKLESTARVAAFAGPYPQKLNDYAFNAWDIAHGMHFEFRDLVKRRPLRERH